MGLRFLTPDEFFNDSCGILLTFDDGFEELYKYAFPILQDEKVCALVFVVSGYTGKKNDWDITLGKSFTHLPWDKIGEMYRYGIKIGSHSHLHPDYTRVSKDLVKEDLKKSYEKISEEIGERIEKLENEPGKRKSLDSCFDIEKKEVLWPSFEGMFEG